MTDLLVRFEMDCGRMGSIDGLFVATRAELERAYGKECNFGEVLGKHSEVFCDFDESMITVASEDQALIKRLVEVFGDKDISGYNPLAYIGEDWEADEEE